ncbi:MAG TPA: MarR family winged helix-turn-helix transcriptional regulator [Steroidobacteraceae bacterium]
MPREAVLRLEQFLPYRLSVLANTVSAAIAAAYAERFRLSIPEWRVLAILACTPHLSAAEVAERTAMDKVAVSRAVAALLRVRRLRRTIARGDRRRSVLSLSHTGERIYAQVVPFARAYERSLLEGFTRGQLQRLDRMLRELQVRAMRSDRLRSA